MSGKLLHHPSFDAKQGAMRVGTHYAGSAPQSSASGEQTGNSAQSHPAQKNGRGGLGAERHLDADLAAKVAAIKARTTEEAK